MITNSLKMIKIDQNMEFWQIVCKNIILTLVYFFGFTVWKKEYFNQIYRVGFSFNNRLTNDTLSLGELKFHVFLKSSL
jgi:hypothetical protein